MSVPSEPAAERLTAPGSGRPWWQDAVCYEVYVRSFADSNGDGIGDLPGITSRVPYLAELGVDAIWLTPFYPSPQADHGYDVADFRGVDPMFGTLADFDELLATAHRHGLRVLIDVVANHSSTEHAWFREALAAGPGSPARDRYLFRPGRGVDGSEPPNNWQSSFGGPAWTRVDDGEWYLHLFDRGQPDFNWDNPEVGDEFESVLRFWLDRGVDGFRIDVAHGLVKAAGLPDADPNAGGHDLEEWLAELHRPYWDQPGVHDVYRRWHRILASYPGDRMAVGEAWVTSAEAMARYLRPDELQQVFNFHWLNSGWSVEQLAGVIAETMAAVAPHQATPTWVLSNHDVVRHASRLGSGDRGLARARAASMLMLALPGSAYVYQGEELGLPQVEVPEEQRQDPSYLRGHDEGRDGCRVPVPWSGAAPPYGFGPDGSKPWLPQPPEWAELSVQAQGGVAGSTLELYRELLARRRELLHRRGGQLGRRGGPAGGRGAPPDTDGGVEVVIGSDDVLAVRRAHGLVCVVNCGDTDADLHRLAALAPLLEQARPLLASGPAPRLADGVLPPDTAAWLRV